MPCVFEDNLHSRSLCRHHATLLPQEARGEGGVRGAALRDDTENSSCFDSNYGKSYKNYSVNQKGVKSFIIQVSLFR